MEVSTTGLRHAIERPEYKDGQLCWSDCDLNAIADDHGTPVHVGNTSVVGQSVRAFREPFLAHGLPLQIRYSVKTNPLPLFLDLLSNLDVGFEVVSGCEQRLVQSIGVPADRIVVTGYSHDRQLVAADGSSASQMISLSTTQQLEMVRDAASLSSSRIPVGLTLNPGLRRGRWDISLNNSRPRGPLGFKSGSSEFYACLRTIEESQHLELVGFHMHLGSGIQSAKPFSAGLRQLENSILEATRAGHVIRILDIGGGFGSPTAPVLSVRNVVGPFFGLPQFRKSSARFDLLLHRVAKEVTRVFNRLKRCDLSPPVLLAEPGRLLSGPCQLIILSVEDVIRRGKKNYLLCDGGAMALSPMLVTEKHDVRPLRLTDGPSRPHDILGKLPTALDQVARNVPLPEMRTGDRIALLDTGAYFLSFNNTFSGPRPAVVWIDNGRARLARRSESEAELFARDLRV